MDQGFSTRQTWPFECLHCWHVWEEEYVVRHMADGHGHEREIWYRGSVPVQPPWSGCCCPLCGGFRVTSFPSGYLSHHPELRPPVPVAAVEPVESPAMEVAQRQPFRLASGNRLMAAIGLPVVVFVGYELYMNLVRPIHPH